MSNTLTRWVFPASTFVAAALGVFVLPFLFPPPYLQGVSTANVAGFNNKVASVAAALVGVVVFSIQLSRKSTSSSRVPGNYQPLSRIVVLVTGAIVASILAILSYFILESRMRYFGDAGYFIEQISKHADYGRSLYTEIEFPYGPFIFYGPIAVHALLAPFHISREAAYFIIVLLESVGGLLLIAYILNHLPILRKWKTLLFLLAAPASTQLNFGLNYTYLRFTIAAALFIFSARRRRPRGVAACLFAGEMISLGTSPEMGFAFGAASLVFCASAFYRSRDLSWLLAAVAPCLSSAAFLLLAGAGYIGMMRLFAKGIFNFVVEPTLFTVIFVFALVWLTPSTIASFVKEGREEAPVLISLYVMAVALLPVAFGRADPGHVFFNGLLIYILSMISMATLRRPAKTVWALCIAGSFLWPVYMDALPYELETRSAIHHFILHGGNDSLRTAAIAFTRELSPAAADHYLLATFESDQKPLDIGKLRSIVGTSPVATPNLIPINYEEALKRSGQYKPSIYCFRVGVLDKSAEEREIKDLNSSEWALLPAAVEVEMTDVPAGILSVLGFPFSYKVRRTPYVVGKLFEANLKEQWQPYAQLDEFVLYRRKQ